MSRGVSGEPAPADVSPAGLDTPVQTEPPQSTACVSLSLPAPKRLAQGVLFTVPGVNVSLDPVGAGENRGDMASIPLPASPRLWRAADPHPQLCELCIEDTGGGTSSTPSTPARGGLARRPCTPSCSCTPSCAWLSTPGEPPEPSHIHPFLRPLPEKHHLLGLGNLERPITSRRR